MIKWICMFAFYFYLVVYSKFNLQKVTCCSCVWHSTPNSAFFPVLSFPCPLFLTGPLHSYLQQRFFSRPLFSLSTFLNRSSSQLPLSNWFFSSINVLPSWPAFGKEFQAHFYQGMAMKAFHEATCWFVCRLGCHTGEGPLGTESNWNALDLISTSEWFTSFPLSLSGNLWLFACCFYRVGEWYRLLPQMEQSCMTFQRPYRHCCQLMFCTGHTQLVSCPGL